MFSPTFDMELSTAIFVFALIICCTVHRHVQCVVVDHFRYYTGFTEKVCPLADVVFSETLPSLITCAVRCKNAPTCLGVFYSKHDAMCTGCLGNYDDINALDSSVGTVYFKMVKCYDPITISTSGVTLGPMNSYTNIGATVTYSCSPCSLFPRDTITCTSLGVWSGSAECISGPETGVLRNGDPIPPGAKGCNGVCGDHISDGLALLGGIGCYCDSVCCEYSDCCFDVPLCSP